MVSSRRVILACLLTLALVVPVGAFLGTSSSSSAVARSLAAPPAVVSASAAAAPRAVRPSIAPRHGVTSSVALGTVSPSAVAPTSMAPAPQPSAVSPENLAGWGALHAGTNGALVDPYTPPDVIVAAGPDHVVEMVNLIMGVYSKQGAQLNVTDLTVFFKSGTDFISDPKVQYDPGSGRWFATVTDVTATQVLLAVSKSADPTAAWTLYRVPNVATGECLDQPILGVGTATVIVSVNVFTQTSPSNCVSPYLGAEYWVIAKSDLVTGSASPATYDSGINPLEGSIHPVQVEGTSPVNYMVATYWPGTATTSNTLHLFTVSGTPPVVTVNVTSLSMPTAAIPPSSPQLGSKSDIDTADIRVSDAVWTAGNLWLGFDEACLADATRACIRLVQIDTTAGRILQDFDIDVAGRSTFYPGLRVDGAGDLVVVFGYASATDYPGIMVTGRVFGDAANTLQTPQIVAPGTGPETTFCSKSVCRYGDYFGASRDPSNASVVWLAGELGTTAGWSTHVFAVSVKAELTLAYQVVGGGSGYGAPSVSFVHGGVGTQATIGTTAGTFLADPGTAWSVGASLPGSSITSGQVWVVNASAAPMSGVANASVTASYRYFHQYAATFGVQVMGHTGYLAPPQLNLSVFGIVMSTAAPETLFVDAGTPYAYPTLLSGSTSTARWEARTPPSGTIAGPLNVSATYYYQVVVTFLYTIQGTATGATPQVHYLYLGSPTATTMNTTVWADAQAPYAYDTVFGSASADVRWGIGANGNGTVTAPTTITEAYREQFRVNVLADPGTLASSVTTSGWYDAGSTLTLSAAAPSGWRFDRWTGDASGTAANVTVTVNAPMNATALFDARLVITAGDGGSVSYAYGSTSGTVPAGSSVAIYVPAGTGVSLTATPSAWYRTFDGWSGAAAGGTSSTTVQVNAPGTVAGSFGLDLVVVGGLGLLVVVVIVAAVALAVVRRRRKRNP